MNNWPCVLCERPVIISSDDYRALVSAMRPKQTHELVSAINRFAFCTECRTLPDHVIETRTQEIRAAEAEEWSLIDDALGFREDFDLPDLDER